jgi:hypothetical protein
MKLPGKFGRFVLTKQEQRTIAFIVLILVLGLATKYYRAQHTEPAASAHEIRGATPTPTAAR